MGRQTDQIMKLQGQLKMAKDEMEKSLTNYDRLMQKTHDLKNELQESVTQNAQLHQDNQARLADLDSKEEEVRVLRSQIARQTRENDRLKKQIISLEVRPIFIHMFALVHFPLLFFPLIEGTFFSFLFFFF